MTVSSINVNTAAALGTTDTTLRSGPQRPDGPPPMGPAGSAEFSKMGQMMAKLEELASNDPEKFKTLTAQIAEQLQTASEEATGEDATMLADMAEKFATAAETGSAESLRPPKPPQGGTPPDQSPTQTSATTNGSSMVAALLKTYQRDEQTDTSAASLLTNALKTSQRPHGPSDAVKAVWDDVFAIVGNA